MNNKNVFGRWFCLAAVAWLMLGLANSGWAQTTLNVTDFGAKGDLLTLSSVNTASNSTTLICPGANFSATDINKLVEVFGGGTWRGISNETLVAFITTVSSPSTITISTAAGTTANGLTGVYGTDSAIGFNSAIAACAIPTGTIVIPGGNYLLVSRDLIYGHDFVYPGYGLGPTAIPLTRGGITFIGQGNAILTGCGGWKNLDSQGKRGEIFGLAAPMINDYPLVFTNLTFDGGVAVGNIRNLSYPPSGSTGEGWDGSHHWIASGGSGLVVSSIVMQNCTVRHWRGEMMELANIAPNNMLTATNCLFYDGDGSCINNFAHNVTSCIFSNANQAEEFYRTYAANASVMANCLFTGLNSAIALNGGYYGCPTYTISGNTFTNFYGGGYALLTTPACDVLFVSNTVCTSQGVALGVAGYQGSTINSNILVAWNTFNGAQYPLQILGNGENSSANVLFCSNQVNNAWGIGNGYGWSTNISVFNNVGVNCGRFDQGSLQGQYFLDVSNRYNGERLGDSFALTNIFTYAHGALGQMQNGVSTAKYGLDNTQPAKIPAGAMMIISNASANTYPLYPAANLSGTPVMVIGGQTAIFYWTNGVWTTNSSSSTSAPPPPPAPPTNLHPL